MSQNPSVTKRSDEWAARYTMTLDKLVNSVAATTGGAEEAGPERATSDSPAGTKSGMKIKIPEMLLVASFDLDARPLRAREDASSPSLQ